MPERKGLSPKWIGVIAGIIVLVVRIIMWEMRHPWIIHEPAMWGVPVRTVILAIVIILIAIFGDDD